MISSMFEDVDLWGACTVVEHRTGRWSRLAGARRVIAEARSVIRRDPEILVFSGMQFLWCAISYYLWSWSYTWNPWLGFDTIEGLWVSIWVMASGVPIGILTTAMCSSVVQRSRGQNSTFWSCLGHAFRRFWSAGAFQAVDAWITLKRISQRASDRERGSARGVLGHILEAIPDAAWEYLYQGWKAATLGILPALSAGKSLSEAIDSSLGLLKERPVDVLALRFAYSIANWIVAIPTFLIASAIFFQQKSAFIGSSLNPVWLYKVGVLLLVDLLLIHLVIRPIFLVCSTALWVEWDRTTEIGSPPDPVVDTHSEKHSGIVIRID